MAPATAGRRVFRTFGLLLAGTARGTPVCRRPRCGAPLSVRLSRHTRPGGDPGRPVRTGRPRDRSEALGGYRHASMDTRSPPTRIRPLRRRDDADEADLATEAIEAAAGLLVAPEGEEDTRGQNLTALASIVAAAFLVVLKLGTGLITGSLGLISSGIEASGDVVAAVLTLLRAAPRLAPRRPPHPYGHRRAENLAALGEAAILTGGGIVILVEAISRLTGGGETLEPALVRVRRHRRRAASSTSRA